VSLPMGSTPQRPFEGAADADAIAELRALCPHVLVAEDTPLNRELVERMLSSFGCRVTSVEDGARAVSELCRTHDYSLALLDWHMPVMDGLEATRRVRTFEEVQGKQRLAILAFTASAFSDEAARCRVAGMDGVLNKPLTKVQLLKALRAQLLGRADVTGGFARIVVQQQQTKATPPAVERVLRDSQINELLELDRATPDGFLADLVDSYLSAAPERLDELAAAIRAADAERLHQLAHRFRGAAANLGVQVMIEPLQELETLAEHGSLSGADLRITQARAAHERTLGPLRELLQTLRARN